MGCHFGAGRHGGVLADLANISLGACGTGGSTYHDWKVWLLALGQLQIEVDARQAVPIYCLDHSSI